MSTDQTNHRADPVQAVAEALDALNVDGWMVVPHPNTGEPMQERLPVSYLAEAAVTAARPAIEREAKAAALREAADRIDLQDAYEHDGSEYRNAESAAESWLREEAHRIERGAGVSGYAGYEDCDHCGAINVDDLMAERDVLAARLAAVEALAKHPESILEHIGGGNLVTHRRMVSVDDLRAALATGTTTNPQEDQ